MSILLFQSLKSTVHWQSSWTALWDQFVHWLGYQCGHRGTHFMVIGSKRQLQLAGFQWRNLIFRFDFFSSYLSFFLLKLNSNISVMHYYYYLLFSSSLFFELCSVLSMWLTSKWTRTKMVVMLMLILTKLMLVISLFLHRYKDLWLDTYQNAPQIIFFFFDE